MKKICVHIEQEELDIPNGIRKKKKKEFPQAWTIDAKTVVYRLFFPLLQ